MIIKNKLKDNFTIIPNEIIQNKELSNNAFRLLVYLWSKPNDWEVNQRNIAKDFDVHVNSIKRWIKELKGCGYLCILKRNVGQSFDYVYELVHEVQYNVYRENNEVPSHEAPSTKHHLTSGTKMVLHNKTNTTKTEFTNTDNNKTKGTFVKPSLEELKNYCLEKELKNVDVEVFLNYYEANGWLVGKNKMKNWKATISNWNKRDFNTPKPKQQKTIGSTENWNKPIERELTEEETKEMNDIIKKMKGEH